MVVAAAARGLRGKSEEHAQNPSFLFLVSDCILPHVSVSVPRAPASPSSLRGSSGTPASCCLSFSITLAHTVIPPGSLRAVLRAASECNGNLPTHFAPVFPGFFRRLRLVGGKDAPRQAEQPGPASTTARASLLWFGWAGGRRKRGAWAEGMRYLKSVLKECRYARF